jgi:hypothetical protein
VAQLLPQPAAICPAAAAPQMLKNTVQIPDRLSIGQLLAPQLLPCNTIPYQLLLLLPCQVLGTAADWCCCCCCPAALLLLLTQST